ncbi:MAG: hypothetical protein ACR2QA_01570 [Solirubrobacteraceae bacterium]
MPVARALQSADQIVKSPKGAEVGVHLRRELSGLVTQFVDRVPAPPCNLAT